MSVVFHHTLLHWKLSLREGGEKYYILGEGGDSRQVIIVPSAWNKLVSTSGIASALKGPVLCNQLG